MPVPVDECRIKMALAQVSIEMRDGNLEWAVKVGVARQEHVFVSLEQRLIPGDGHTEARVDAAANAHVAEVVDH